jgi:hypothetical protein
MAAGIFESVSATHMFGPREVGSVDINGDPRILHSLILCKHRLPACATAGASWQLALHWAD